MTRDELLHEYSRLVFMRARIEPTYDGWDADQNALDAAIARVDILIDLSDAQCAYLVTHSVAIAHADEDDAEEDDSAHNGIRPSETADAHRAIAALVKRAP